jgi:hypothetical protein
MSSSVLHWARHRVSATHSTMRYGSAGRLVLCSLLIAIIMLSAKAAPEAATLAQSTSPSDAQYLDWVSTQRSLAKASMGQMSDFDSRAKTLDGLGKNELAKAGTDAKKIAHARAELGAAEQLTTLSRRGSTVYNARLSVLDRLASEATLREVHAAGPSYLMVSQTIGTVVVHDLLASEPLQHDRPFRNGEVIETGRDSFAALLLLDGSWLTLGPETTLRAATQGARASYELAKGRLYRKLSCISSGTSRTCGSVFTAFGISLGGDGNEYAVDILPESPAVVTALGGDMTLSTAAPVMTLEKGQWVTLFPGGGLGVPVSGNRNEILHWWNYLSDASQE